MTRYLLGFICVLALGVMGCSETAGKGGSGGGDGGSGGDGGGGQGGVAACIPNELECVSAQIEPIEGMCEVIVPDQPSACSGTENIVNPMSCKSSGDTVIHKLTQMQIAADCDTGHNLDACDGSTCVSPLGTNSDGINGVDNALATVEWLVEQGFPCVDPLGSLDQALHEATCTGATDIEIEVDAVPKESCAVVRLSALGTTSDPIPMNLSDDGCLSGTIGTIPIGLGGTQQAIENTVVRMTVSSLGFSDGILSGTAGPFTAEAMFEEMCDGLSAVAMQFFDINVDLSGNSLEPCSALSMTLRIGGEAVPAQEGGR